ncbi:DUF6228 family protein [Nocardia vinacea]|uniref:DUF6228 family protein n=1 Tax=Nocardia vinacea TaxID=96468 RepID=UPI002E0ED7CD|nr:DUF6228 family protein [Nocardia vinacea]
MECECDQDADQGMAISLGAPGDGTWARLCNRVDQWGDNSIQVCVRIGAPGLLAAVHQVTLAVMGDSDLVWFFDDLARNFTGWDGARVWESMDRDLRVEAVFASHGYVSLTWTVKPWRHMDGNWTASTTVVLEAGEQMLQFARDVHQFLGPVEP